MRIRTKILLVASLAFITVATLTIFRFRGALPAALPAKSPADLINKVENKNTGATVNEPGLQIADGFNISYFAKGVEGARVLMIDSGGTLLVSQPGEGKVVALPDKNKDGKADSTVTVLDGLDRPHGLAERDGKLYVAEVQKLSRYNYDPENLKATSGEQLTTLPSGGRHSTRTLGFDKSGKLYISVGSTCDVCVEADEKLATILSYNPQTKQTEIFAKGLRNSVFFDFHPQSDKIWATEMGRDFLGDNLPPDEINIIEQKKDYGWPYCYGDRVRDNKFESNSSRSCSQTEPPVYKLCAHCAPLGVRFVESKLFPESWQKDLLVSLHGSWNSTRPVGYKVVKLNVEGDKVVGEEDFISGFLKGSQAIGRPVDLIFDDSGNLYVSDDKAGVIYRVWR